MSLLGDDEHTQALRRLELSRARLRETLMPAPRDGAARHDSARLPRRWRAWLRAGPWRGLTRALEPWWDSGALTLHRWWRRHPWRATALALGGAAEHSLLPWVRRHPVAAMCIGAAMGAALVTAAPWRSPTWRNAADRGGRHVRRWLWRQAASPASQALLAGALASFIASQNGAARTGVARPPADGDPSGAAQGHAHTATQGLPASALRAGP